MSISIAENKDCMVAMREFSNNYFDICISDIPYGIGIDGQKPSINKNPKSNRKLHIQKDWDNSIPDKSVFDEMKRVSKNQIIFGANYCCQYLDNGHKGWLIWDKTQRGLTMSDCEIIYTSFDVPTRIIEMNRVELLKQRTIHPTEKPIKLYKIILKMFAKSGNKIIDCFSGSGALRIACYDLGFDSYNYELDTDYFNAQEKRFKDHTDQQRLFVPNKEIEVVKDVELFNPNPN